MKAHISAKKKEVVNGIVKLLKEYPIIGAINMEGLPAKQLQNMRETLRKDVVIFMAKRRLINIAIEHSKKKGLEKLVPFLEGMPALLFTKENPFKLFKIIKKNKSPAPAKAGQKAPKDIVIPAGPTPFAPGPVISELASIGLKTGVENGKVAVKADTVVAEEGTEISGNLAQMLTRLGITPMEVGLDLTAVYEEGEILDKKVLDVDEEQTINDLKNAASWAFNLAIFSAIANKDTINHLIIKALTEAKALALEGDIITEDTKKDIFAKAERQATAVHALVQNK